MRWRRTSALAGVPHHRVGPWSRTFVELRRARVLVRIVIGHRAGALDLHALGHLGHLEDVPQPALVLVCAVLLKLAHDGVCALGHAHAHLRLVDAHHVAQAERRVARLAEHQILCIRGKAIDVRRVSLRGGTLGHHAAEETATGVADGQRKA